MRQPQRVQARIRRGDAQGATINVVGRLLELSGASVEATVIPEVTSEVGIFDMTRHSSPWLSSTRGFGGVRAGAGEGH